MLLSKLPSYFKGRRDALMKSEPGAVFLIYSNDELVRNSDVHFPFRQDSGFYYLTGFDEPDSLLVLAPRLSGAGAYRMILFVRRRDPEKEMWEGERYGIEGAMKIFGADEAYPIEELDSKLPELLAGGERIYYRIGVNEEKDRRILAAVEKFRRSLGRTGKSIPALVDPNTAIGEMRLFKSPEELETLRKVCRLSAEAHKVAMIETKPGMNEYEIEALIDYAFRKAGAHRVAYGSIVAGGRNATCLHYRANNDSLKDGELLLIDAGGELDYYDADITRTFPVGRHFTPGQAKLYDLVLEAQKAGIEMTKPGVTLRQIHQRCCEILTDGMLSLGLLHGNRKEILDTHGYRRFYPHNTSHWLGMDVHDAGLYLKNGEPRPLEPGMCFTVEPGFYVQPNDAAIAGALAEFRNIGIRIEDDVVVTATGCEVLTKDAPKEREEIEALKARG